MVSLLMVTFSISARNTICSTHWRTTLQHICGSLGKSRRNSKPNSIIYDQLNEIAFGNDTETNGEFLRYLLHVLGDMGVVVDNHDGARLAFITHVLPDDAEDPIIEEAILFLAQQLRQDDHPLPIYMKQMGSENLLSKEDEEILGKNMAEGRIEVMEAIAQSPFALNELFLTASAIENGEIPISVLLIKEGGLNSEKIMMKMPIIRKLKLMNTKLKVANEVRFNKSRVTVIFA